MKRNRICPKTAQTCRTVGTDGELFSDCAWGQVVEGYLHIRKVIGLVDGWGGVGIFLCGALLGLVIIVSSCLSVCL